MLPVRFGERLRHKERASLAWDYERLVLERFPEIAKIRVLAARSPGAVTVVVVPGAAGIDAQDKLVPRAGVDICTRIEENLRSAASPFARIQVVDPAYVRIAAQVRVLFRNTFDNASIRLNDDLCDFLSPSGGLDLPDDAGPADVRKAVGDFIESRPYVASLIGLALSFTPDLASVDWCVPTSAARHDIVAGPEPARSDGRVPAPANEDLYV